MSALISGKTKLQKIEIIQFSYFINKLFYLIHNFLKKNSL